MKTGSKTDETPKAEAERILRRMRIVQPQRLVGYDELVNTDPSFDQTRRLRFLRQWEREDKASTAENNARFAAMQKESRR